MTTQLVLLAGALNLLATFIYVREVLRKKTIPETTSWILWFLISISALVMYNELDSSKALLFISAQAIGELIMIILSIKYGKFVFGKKEFLVLAIGLASIFIWVQSANPLLGVYGVIIARSVAIIMTVVKTYRNPTTESITPWIVYLCSASLALVAALVYNDSTALPYFIYVFLADVSIFIAKYHTRLWEPH